jgi:hypothetical protein
MKKVIIYTEDRRFGNGEILVFSNAKKCLDYFQKLYPEKKNLRLRKGEYSNLFTLLNYNTVLLPWDADIREGKLDPNG